MAAAALVAHRSGAASGGGFLNSIFGGGGGDANPTDASATTPTGAAQSIPQGLGALIQQFEQNGLGGMAQSWISNGANQSITPDQVHQALGPEAINQLSQQTGTSREDLLSELAQALPKFMDQLTPNGRVPEQHEIAAAQQQTSN